VGLWPLTSLFNNNLSMASKVLAEESKGGSSSTAFEGRGYLSTAISGAKGLPSWLVDILL